MIRAIVAAASLVAAMLLEPDTARADLYVSSMFGATVGRYDALSGTGGVLVPSAGEERTGIAFGPDAMLYVTTGSRVERHDPTTGALLATFDDAPRPGLPQRVLTALAFGPDHSLYVNDTTYSQVLRYDGASGAYLGVFAPVSDILSHGLVFTPDGALMLVTTELFTIRSYDATTGASRGTFAGDRRHSGQLAFGPDGRLYTTNYFGNDVRRFDGTTGAALGTFAAGGGLTQPFGLAFGPEGNLYVSSGGDDRIYVYDGATGAALRSFPATGLNLASLTNLAFSAPVPEPESYLLCLAGLALVATRLRSRAGATSPARGATRRARPAARHARFSRRPPCRLPA